MKIPLKIRVLLDSSSLALHHPSHPKLIPRSHRLASHKIDLHQLLALHLSPILILQAVQDLLRLYVNHIARRRISKFPIVAERDPSRLIVYLDRRCLFRRHYRVVKHVHPAVVAIRHPHFFFVRRQAYAVTWTAVAFHPTLLKTLHFDAIQFLAGGDVADLETEQAVDADVAE